MGGETTENQDCCANVGAARASETTMASAAAATPRPLRDLGDVSNRVNEETDHGWVVRLIEREGPGILRMLWRILGREQDVMDAYQDCFCKLAASGRRGNITRAKPYAYRTAANIAIEMIRVRTRRAAHWPAIATQRARAHAEANSDEPTEYEPSNAAERLREAVTQLPDHLRNVVVLRDLSRMSYDEVGRTLGIEPTTARVYRRHAVIKLAELLAEEGDPS